MNISVVIFTVLFVVLPFLFYKRKEINQNLKSIESKISFYSLIFILIFFIWATTLYGSNYPWP